MIEKIMVVQEHHLKLEADLLRLKIIAEAIGEYVGKHTELMDDTTLEDFKFNMETAYQRWFGLDKDDWNYTKEHREEISINE